MIRVVARQIDRSTTKADFLKDVVDLIPRSNHHSGRKNTENMRLGTESNPSLVSKKPEQSADAAGHCDD